MAATMAVVIAAGSMDARAQQADDLPHTVHVSVVTPPSGPDSDFSYKLSMSPSDVDISGFGFVIAYDNTKATLISVSDNTGQEFAGVQYDLGNETAFSEVSYANVFVPVIMTTLSDLVEPEDLAELHFHSTPAYDESRNEFYVFIGGWPRDAGGLSGDIFDPDGEPNIPTEYDSLNPASAVSHWMLY